MIRNSKKHTQLIQKKAGREEQRNKKQLGKIENK